jgi:hypothetical protein
VALQLQINPEGGKSYYWEPFPKQTQFIEIPDSVKEALFGGAAGPGKSDLLILLPILRRWHENPRFKGIIFRITNKELEQSLIPRSKEYYPHFGGKFNETLNKWTFPSGAWIILSYLETEQDAREHDTAEYNYIGFDELTHFQLFVYIYMLSRCRTSDPDLPAIMRAATNPGNIGHMWVRERFVEPAPEGGKLIKDPVSGIRRIFIKATAKDNPILSKLNPDYYNQLRELEKVSPAEYRAKALGDWWVFSGQVFSKFRIDHVEGEPENALHVIPGFEIPKWWPKVAALDWGGSNPETAAMTWFGIAAISPTGRYYLYKELTWKGQPVSTWGTEIGMICRDENVRIVSMDPSAWGKKGEEKSLAEQFLDFSGLENVDRADNDRIGGKELVQEAIRWEARPPKYIPPEGYSQDTYFYILRNHGQAAANSYYNLFLPEKPEENLPKLQIFKSCQAVIKAISSCVYNDDTKGNIEDVKEFHGDDPYDGLRYLLKRIDRYLKEVVTESEHLQKLGEITQRLERTGDQTVFYRQMERMEATEKDDEKPVAAYHDANPFRRKGNTWGVSRVEEGHDEYWDTTRWPFRR